MRDEGVLHRVGEFDGLDALFGGGDEFRSIQDGGDEVLLDADLDNPASWKTMEYFGGKRIREYFDDKEDMCMTVDYTIDVKKALADHKDFEDQTIKNI